MSVGLPYGIQSSESSPEVQQTIMGSSSGPGSVDDEKFDDESSESGSRRGKSSKKARKPRTIYRYLLVDLKFFETRKQKIIIKCSVRINLTSFYEDFQKLNILHSRKGQNLLRISDWLKLKVLSSWFK